MTELTHFQLISSVFTILGLGIAIGFKLGEKKQPLIQQRFLCKIAHFTLPNRHNIYINNKGKKVGTDCPWFIEKNKICKKIQKKCMLYVDFDYEVEYKEYIEKFKKDKNN